VYDRLFHITLAGFRTKIDDINPEFKIQPRAYSPRLFTVQIEANVIGTNDAVFYGIRHIFEFCTLKITKNHAWLFFNKEDMRDRHRVDTWAPIKVYKNWDSQTAKKAAHRLKERIALLIAPHHEIQVSRSELAQKMCDEIHKQLTVMAVLNI
jgi:hypothetical protein